MLSYGDMVEWSRLFDRLSNRVAICNQLFGCRYENCPENDFRICMDHKRYSVMFRGYEIASFGVWDLDSLRDSLWVLESWENCIWHMSRQGVLSVA